MSTITSPAPLLETAVETNPDRNNCHWSAEERRVIIEAAFILQPWDPVARTLGRTVGGCANELKRLLAGERPCPAGFEQKLAVIRDRETAAGKRTTPTAIGADQALEEFRTLSNASQRQVDALADLARLVHYSIAREILDESIDAGELYHILGDTAYRPIETMQRRLAGLRERMAGIADAMDEAGIAADDETDREPAVLISKGDLLYWRKVDEPIDEPAVLVSEGDMLYWREVDEPIDDLAEAIEEIAETERTAAPCEPHADAAHPGWFVRACRAVGRFLWPPALEARPEPGPLVVDLAVTGRARPVTITDTTTDALVDDANAFAIGGGVYAAPPVIVGQGDYATAWPGAK